MNGRAGAQARERRRHRGGEVVDRRAEWAQQPVAVRGDLIRALRIERPAAGKDRGAEHLRLVAARHVDDGTQLENGPGRGAEARDEGDCDERGIHVHAAR